MNKKLRNYSLLLAALMSASACNAQKTMPGQQQSAIAPNHQNTKTMPTTVAEPAGKLIYCSYSNSAPAGGGKNYCEFIADSDSIEVVICTNADSRLEKEVKRTFSATKEDAVALQNLLKQLKVWTLDGIHRWRRSTRSKTLPHLPRIRKWRTPQFCLVQRWSHSRATDCLQCH